MKAAIVQYLMGIVAFDSENRILDSISFPPHVPELCSILQRLQRNELLHELPPLIQSLQAKGYTTFIFEDPALAKNIQETCDVDVEVQWPSSAGRFLRNNVVDIALQLGHVPSSETYSSLLHRVSNALAREDIQQRSEKRDLLLANAVLVLDDLDKTCNLFANRVKEWYGLYFPELGTLVNRNETYLRLAASMLNRESFTQDGLIGQGITPDNAASIATVAGTSMGGEISPRDLTEIQGFVRNLLGLYQSRSTLEHYIDEVMQDIAPNLRTIAGSTVGARLIAIVGSLEGLAKRSSSKIQVLGAEKALYRAFRTGTRPPKHGLIFQHPLVHGAPRWQRGKIARVLAAKIAIAARIDLYRGDYRGEDLNADLQQRVLEIQKKYAQPSPRKAKKRSRRR